MKNLLYVLILMPLASFAQAPSFQQEFGGNLDFHRNHIILLIDAIPDDKLSWRTNEDVRSISEVVAHIAASTYNLALPLGGTLPEGVDPATFEASLKTKADLKNAINNAFDFAKNAAAAVPNGELETQIELPFGTFTKRGVMTIILAHDTEHKGQFIAYARFIGVTPPWSAES